MRRCRTKPIVRRFHQLPYRARDSAKGSKRGLSGEARESAAVKQKGEGCLLLDDAGSDPADAIGLAAIVSGVELVEIGLGLTAPAWVPSRRRPPCDGPAGVALAPLLSWSG